MAAILSVLLLKKVLKMKIENTKELQKLDVYLNAHNTYIASKNTDTKAENN